MALSRRQVQDFVKDPVWKEIVGLVADRIGLVTGDLEVAPKESIRANVQSGENTKVVLLKRGVEYLQGEVVSLRYVSTLPKILLGTIDDGIVEGGVRDGKEEGEG